MLAGGWQPGNVADDARWPAGGRWAEGGGRSSAASCSSYTCPDPGIPAAQPAEAGDWTQRNLPKAKRLKTTSTRGNLKKAELQSECQRLGIKAYGNLEQLIQRLEYHDEHGFERSQGMARLKQECRNRGMTVGGNLGQIFARLEQHHRCGFEQSQTSPWLKAECERRGLAVGGNVGELLQRLERHQAFGFERSLGQRLLKEECRKRGLEVGGSVGVLMDRLVLNYCVDPMRSPQEKALALQLLQEN